jgi:hypothetical protein
MKALLYNTDNDSNKESNIQIDWNLKITYPFFKSD